MLETIAMCTVPFIWLYIAIDDHIWKKKELKMWQDLNEKTFSYVLRELTTIQVMLADKKKEENKETIDDLLKGYGWKGPQTFTMENKEVIE